MNRELVLEDILRAEAADIVATPDALTAILNAGPPVAHESSNEEQRSNQSQNSTASSSSVAAASSAATSGAAAASGSFLGLLFKLAAGVVVASVVAAVVVLATPVGPQLCPSLGSVTTALNNELDLRDAGRQVDIPCGSEVATVDDVIALAPADVAADLEANRDEIADAIACLQSAAEPLNLGNLTDIPPSTCSDLLSE